MKSSQFASVMGGQNAARLRLLINSAPHEYRPFGPNVEIPIDTGPTLTAQLPIAIVNNEITNNGDNVFASGPHSWAEGISTTALKFASHAEGNGIYPAEMALIDTAVTESQTIHVTNTVLFHVGMYVKIDTDFYVIDAIDEDTQIITLASEITCDANTAIWPMTIADGVAAHAEGRTTQALDTAAHAEGFFTFAEATAAHAEGYGSVAEGVYSHAEGLAGHATDVAAHAEGEDTYATAEAAHAEGTYSEAQAYAAHAEGYTTIASGRAAHAEGYQTIASGYDSHAEGDRTNATHNGAHAEGSETIAEGDYAHAEGSKTHAQNTAAHAEGVSTYAMEEATHAEGKFTYARIAGSHVEGYGKRSKYWVIQTALGGASIIPLDNVDGLGDHVYVRHGSDTYRIATGGVDRDNHTITLEGATITCDQYDKLYFETGSYGNANYSHVEGYDCQTGGEYAHAEGRATCAASFQCHAEGDGTVANAQSAHAEGRYTRSYGAASHAEGQNTETSNDYAHAEGLDTLASGEAAHAEGKSTIANGESSHSGGTKATANADNSFAHGDNVFMSRAAGTAFGQYNSDALAQFVIGDGSEGNPHDSFKIDASGKLWFLRNGVLVDLDALLTSHGI